MISIVKLFYVQPSVSLHETSIAHLDSYIDGLHYSTKKREHSFSILKAFSFDTLQSMKRRITTERWTEIYSQMRVHVI